MDKNSTITIQELRRDPAGFLRQVNRGKTVTVIYHSKPFAVVQSANKKAPRKKSIQRMLEYAELARSSAKAPLDPAVDYKRVYHQDMAKKHDVS